MRPPHLACRYPSHQLRALANHGTQAGPVQVECSRGASLVEPQIFLTETTLLLISQDQVVLSMATVQRQASALPRR